MFKKLRKQFSEEEKAFTVIKKKYAHLAKLRDDEILLYCECKSRSDIIHYVNQLKKDEFIDKSIEVAICTCSDGSGNIKNLYLSRKDAEQVSALARKEQNITLNIYACPTSTGWHLSKE